MPSARKKCICQLCTCGRHMCPHRKKDQVVLGSEKSSAKVSKQSLSIEEKKRQRKQWNRSSEALDMPLTENIEDGSSTLTETISRSVAVTVQDKGNKTEVSNVKDARWSSKNVAKTMPIKRPDNLKAEGTADFQTTHQQDFNRKSLVLQQTSHSLDSTSAAAIKEASWNHKQIPKTQKIKNPDTLTFSGSTNVETTHKSEFSESVFQSQLSEDVTKQNGTFQRPRTSLKMSGEFESDSSYQRAFTPKKRGEEYKVKKGTSQSSLKPEGEMSFSTTSLDYNTVSTRVSRASEKTETLGALKPKKARPASEIKIPSDPISDETTAVTDFKKWKVQKPTRRKPLDTLQLGDSSESQVTSQANASVTRSQTSKVETSMSNWDVSRPVVQKPENNLKPEGDFSFTTSHDVDYSSMRDRLSMRHSNLEALSERTEKDSVMTTDRDESFRMAQERERTFIADATKKDIVQREGNLAEIDGGIGNIKQVEIIENLHEDTTGDTAQKSEEMITTVTQQNATAKDNVELVQEQAVASPDAINKESEDHDYSEEQSQYVSWDQIRPKPIRPHSNLKQEGGMEFDTTNRREFVSKSFERVKGIRPKTTTKMFEGDFDSTTMNQVMFSNEQVERVNPIRPKSNLHVESGDFVDETTTSREFQAWHVQKPVSIVPQSNLGQEGAIDFTTTNDVDFEEKRLEKVHAIRPTITNKIVGGDTDMTTTNRTMHSEFPLERVKKIIPQSTLRASSGEFTSETTNRSEFQDWGIDRPKPIKPVSNLKQEGSMDFTTMNQLQFEEKQIEHLSQFRPQTSSKITGDFDGTTTNQVMYAAQAIDRPQMIKPKGNIELEKGKFATSTTNTAEFQQWQQSKSEAVTPRNNLHQEGNIDFITTNDTQYGIKAIDRVSEIRPITNSKITGKFDSTTTNQVMFQNTPGEKSQAIRPKTNIRLDEGNFADETTNSKEFKTWEYSKPSPIKPHSSLHQEGSIDFTTMNDTQFTGQTQVRVSEIRPAASTKIMGDGDFDGTTTNQAMFHANSIEKVRGKRPSTNIHLESGKFEDQTTARREYQEWNLSRPEPIKPSGNLIQEGQMDFVTSNQTDFNEKVITRVEPIRPHATSPTTGKFDGTTTNQVMFQMQSVEKVHDIRPKDNLRVSSGQFDGETTNTREFGFKAGSKPDSIKPKPNLTQDGEFDFKTSNQLQFEEKAITKLAQIRPKTLTKASDGTFYSTTTNQEMFQTPAMEVVRGKKPSDNILVESGEFQGETTTSHEYQQWKVQKPKSFQLVSSLAQEGDMSFETTNSSEFKERDFDRVQAVRPKTTNKIEGDFDATTTNQAMFPLPEKLERVKPIRHEDNLHVEDGKFSKETTSKREYRQWVKMENRESPNKTTQAAGVRTQKGKVSKATESKSDMTTQLVEKENSESWKLNEEAKESTMSREKIDLIKSDDKMKSSRSENTNANIVVTRASPKSPQSLNEKTSEIQNGTNISRSTTNADKQNGAKDISTTKTDYGSKSSPSKVKTTIPTGNLNLSGEMSFATTSQTDFAQQSQTSRRQQSNAIVQGPSGNLNLSGEMTFATTSQTDFAGQSPTSRRQQSKTVVQGPSGNLNLSGEMSFSTTSQSDFAQQSQTTRRQQSSAIVQNHSPTQRVSRKGSPHYESWKLAENKLISKTSAATEHRESASAASKTQTETTQRHEIQRSPVKVPPKRFKPDDNLKIEAVPFDGESTSRVEFKKWEARRSSSKKRSETLKQEGKMEFDVTSGDYSLTKSYQQNRETTKAKSKADQRGSLGQSGSMDFHTTQTSSYTANVGSRSKNLRPRSSLKLGMEDSSSHAANTSTRSNPETSRDYDLTSTSHASYVSHSTNRRAQAHRPTTSQKVGQGSFEGQTTSKSSFPAHQDNVEKARSLKPASHNIIDTGSGFVGDTTYRKSFESKKEFHCPVFDLEAGRSCLSFNEEKNGHMFYAPKAQG